jgi:GNAT superfamily N-acetyltransferase
MFQDMGEASPDAFETLRAKGRARIEEWLERGDYIGWLASLPDQPETVIAGAGIQLQPILPRPLSYTIIGQGRQAIIVNVFTEPQWRRRGIASFLTKEIISWSRSEHVDRVVLHASNEGRLVYERLGFIATNEMRLSRDS